MMNWLRDLFFGKDAAEPAAEPSPENAALVRVTERATRNGNPEDRKVPVPLLTLEEFFSGNDETGSIGCNLLSAPTPGQFYDLLASLREREDVSDIRVQITCLDDPGRQWPFSDTIWFVTTASEVAVRSWFPSELAPDEVWTGWQDRTLYEKCEVPDGHRPVAAWYD